MPLTGSEAGDKVVNTFAFTKPGAYTPGDATALCERVQSFYSIAPSGQTNPLSYYFSAVIDRAIDICQMKVYDITGKLGNRSETLGPEPHGSPILNFPWEVNAAGTQTSLPQQISCAMTLRARNALNYPVEAPDAGDPGFDIDRPRARRTGKLYLGPLSQDAATASAGLPSRPSTTFTNVALAAAEGLQDAVNVFGYGWGVWSRQNAAISIIERVEVDNSFDVIRKRKATTTTRTPRIFAPVPDLALGA